MAKQEWVLGEPTYIDDKVEWVLGGPFVEIDGTAEEPAPSNIIYDYSIAIGGAT